MSRHPVPTGADRQALFDELSAVLTRCSEQASAIERQRDAALGRLPATLPLQAKRDTAVRDAERKADAAESKAGRLRIASVQFADDEFFETAQAADATRQRSGIELDRERATAIADARDRFEHTIRAIHQATIGLQSIADAEQKARRERDQTIEEVEQSFRDDLQKADAARQDALDAALSKQIQAHAAADNLHSQAVADVQALLVDAIALADRALRDALAAIPQGKAILDEAQRQLEALDRRCDAQKQVIEAKLRGDD